MSLPVFKTREGFFKVIADTNLHCKNCALHPEEKAPLCYEINYMCSRGQIFTYATEEEYMLAKLKGEARE